MEDLEDYFQRLDQRLNEGERDEESEEAPGHVPRLTPDESARPWAALVARRERHSKD